MAGNLVFIVPAAGQGTRMKSDIPKILLPVAGKTVISRTLEAITSYAKITDLKVSLVLVTTAELKEELKSIAARLLPGIKWTVTIGGSTRTESVSNGINAISELLPDIAPDDLVLIHDGARCLVTTDVIDRVVMGLSSCSVCVAAVPVKDTIKIVKSKDSGLFAEVTPDRDKLYAVQTPQGFRYSALKDCYEYARVNNINATDDTALAERLGLEVRISEGDYSNIKITTPEDIAVAAGISDRLSEG